MNEVKSAAWILLGFGLAACPCAVTAEPPPAKDSSFISHLVEQARASAAAKYEEPKSSLPDGWRDLTYDDYMAIGFQRERALWFDQPGRFQIQFFHPGYLYREPVQIHILEDGSEHLVEFSPDMFDYGARKFPQALPDHLFLTGLRVLYPLNERSKMDEVAVFLGSSYFRVLGRGQTYGSSARGLTVDTAEESGEEFPRFTAFWIEKPEPSADEIRLFALLESRRVAGAYQFVIKPGESSVVDVEARLFLREEIRKLGLAPVTSMFVFGENRTRYFPDFRPEVHDSDGLLVESSTRTWEWRPLMNPAKHHHIGVFPNARGFGLLQRDRNGDHYQDLEAHYERRPSFWITPKEDWGNGRVELVEIPTTEERNDNIVAYWVPETPVPPRQEYRFHYELRATLAETDQLTSDLLRVQATRLQPGKNSHLRAVIDFAGGTLPSAGATPESRVQASKGQVANVVIQRNEELDGWRVVFDLVPEGDSPAELRVCLMQGARIVSETWVYHLTAD